jgi:hypothetical protein
MQAAPELLGTIRPALSLVPVFGVTLFFHVAVVEGALLVQEDAHAVVCVVAPPDHSFRWLGRGADAPRLATGRLCVRPLQGGSTTRCTTLLITPWRCRGMWAAAAHAGTRRSSRRRTRVPPLCSGCLVQRQISLLGLDSEWCLVKLRRTFRWPLPCLSGTDHTVFPRALGGQRPGGPS